jgi:RNA polymerase sigma-70 factor (ECF subfamily)
LADSLNVVLNLTVLGFQDDKLGATVASSLSEYSLEELIEACKREGIPEVWEELLFRTHTFVYKIVRSELRKWERFSIDSTDDIVQDVFLKLSANHAALLRGFQVRHGGAILGYFRAVATSATLDYCRSQTAQKRGSGAVHESLDEAHSVAAGDDHTEDTILLSQINRALDDVLSYQTGQRDRAVFWLYYRHGLTASSIAAISSLGLTTKGVESLIQRLTRLIRDKLAPQPAMRQSRLAAALKRKKPL